MLWPHVRAKNPFVDLARWPTRFEGVFVAHLHGDLLPLREWLGRSPPPPPPPPLPPFWAVDVLLDDLPLISRRTWDMNQIFEA